MENTSWFSLSLLCLLQLTIFAEGREHNPKAITRIDTHSHYIPPFYAKLLMEKNITAGGIRIPAWNVHQHLAVMDLLNVSLSIVSVSTPGAVLMDGFPVDQSRKLARQLNEYGYRLSMEYPKKFKFFATLTLPDVEGSVAEALYALDCLHAAGVIILASSSGEFLGSPLFDPLYAELDKRNAIVFVHPSQSPCPGPVICKFFVGRDFHYHLTIKSHWIAFVDPQNVAVLPALQNYGSVNAESTGLPPFAVDFLLDTTRAAVNLIYRDVTTKYPKIKFLLAHSGGFLPFAASRITGALRLLKNQAEDSTLSQLKSFYLDTAISGNKYALPSTLSLVDTSHLTFGSDFPFNPYPSAVSLDQYVQQELTREAGDQINFKNAGHLFSHTPRDDYCTCLSNDTS